MRYIEDLRDNENIIEHYLCKQKQSLKTKAGKTYYSLKLMDKTGIIDAKVWELTNDIQNFEEGDMVKVGAVVAAYQGDLQLRVSKLRRSVEGEYIIGNYIPTTEKDIETMYAQVVEIIKSISHPHVRKLLENIFIGNKDQVAAFKARSAAKSMHHAYMGGLLEHTLGVAEICDFMSDRYKHLNRDILMAGALLHDIGKIYELAEMPVNDYTDDGQMLGHIVIGCEMVTLEVAKIPDFSHELASMIKHCIISHHGEFEFGSPKLPCIPEAMMLHYADNMDAKLKTFEEAFNADKTQGPWTGYHRLLNRYLRRSDF